MARGDLIVALICSDYWRLGWCQAPTNSDWKELLGPGSKEGLDLVIRGSDSEQVALRAVDRGYATEGLLGKLRIDLSADVVKELMVDRVYLEHALCKVMRLSKDDTMKMLKNKKLRRV